MDFDPYSVDLDVLIPRYLVHAYLYYRQGTTLISDQCFDSIARRLHQEWDNVTHPHKELIEHDALLSGANYIQFPRRIEQAAHYLLDNKPEPQPKQMSFNINKLHKAIDKWSMDQGELDLRIYVPDNSKKKRNHLGMSEIAEPCTRAAWYKFRKIFNKPIEPRMMRLFQRGHREEFIFMHMLREVGLTIWDEDPKTGKQFKVVDFDEHFQGSMDGITKDKKELYIKGKKPFLTEYKTSNDARFKELKKSGLKKWSPKYWGQIQSYMGYEPRLIGCLFCVVNKNTDELYLEWVEPDKSAFKLCQSNAEEILSAERPPRRISNRPAFWLCKMCDFKNHCFKKDVESAKSCRSCRNAYPAENGEWGCDLGKEYGELCDKWEDCNVK